MGTQARRLTTFATVAVASLIASVAPAAALDDLETRRFTAVADAFVSEIAPRTNFGGASRLLATRSPSQRAYLRFHLRDLGGEVVSAKLWVYAVRGARAGYRANKVTGAWSERTLRYSNAPTLRGIGSATGPIRSHGWASRDVSPLVSAEGYVDIGLTSGAVARRLTLASSETTRAPRLTVKVRPDRRAPTAPTGIVVASTTKTTISIAWSASTGDVAVAGYNVFVDGAKVGSTTSTSYTAGGLSCATSHTLEVEAFDGAGNVSARSSTSGETSACTAGSTPPSVAVASPAPGTAFTFPQTVVVNASASDDGGVTKVEFLRDGAVVATDTASPYESSWAVTSADNGVHDWTARAYDQAGNTATSAAVQLAVSITVSATTYYLDATNGNDVNSGTSEGGAWKTLGRANAAVLLPGDRLLLRRGGTWTSSLAVAESGTLAAPITVAAYGTGEDPIIRGASSCVVLSGSHIVVQSLHAHDCSWAGVSIAGSYNRLEASMITSNAAGVHVRSTAVGTRVVGNEVRDNNKMSVLTASPSDDDSGAFGIAVHGDRTEVAWNVISGSDAFSYDYGRDGAAVEIYGGTNSNVHHNLAVDNDAFTELGNSRSADNAYTHNVVRSSLATSIFLVTRGASSSFGPVLRTTASNNTVVFTGSSSQGFVCHAGCGPDILKMRNNVIQAVWKVGYADAAFDEDYDLLWGGIAQFTKGSHTLVADPQFANASAHDFHLRATSPAVDHGVGVGLTTDFDGRLIPVDGNGDGTAVADIGAYEYQPASTPPDTTAPSVSLASPSPGATVAGTVTLAATASDDVGVTEAKWYVDGTEVAWDATAPWSETWDSTSVADGTHQVSAKARDAAGNWGTSAVASITVSNGGASSGVVVAAAGDIACAPPGTRSSTTCHHGDTASLITTMNPDRVLMLGDAQYETGTLSNFAAVYDPSWGAFKAKTLGTAGGSHDFYGGGEFFTYFGTTSFPRGAHKPYSVNVGDWHIISMNSGCSDANVGGCGTSSAQYAWLKADLDANAKKCVLAMWHEPFWTSGYRHDNYTVTRPFVDLLYQHGAELLLAGHEHAYERLFPMRPDGTRDDANGIASFVVGTGGKSLETAWGTIEPNSAARQRDTYGVLKLALKASSYDWQFVPEAGKSFSDSGSAACH